MPNLVVNKWDYDLKAFRYRTQVIKNDPKPSEYDPISVHVYQLVFSKKYPETYFSFAPERGSMISGGVTCRISNDGRTFGKRVWIRKQETGIICPFLCAKHQMDNFRLLALSNN